MTITFVTLPDSQLQLDNLELVMTAGVVVEGIDASAAPNSVLLSVYDQIINQYPNFPGNPSLHLKSMLLRGNNTNTVTGTVTYRTGTPEVSSAAIIRFTGFITGQETNLVPGLRIPIRVGWEGNTVSTFDKDGATVTFTPKVADDLVAMRFFLPVMSVGISGLVFGAPSNAFQEGVAYVNDAQWPTGTGNIVKPKPLGYWMLQKYDLSIAKYKGYYTYEAVVGSRVFADWSETGVLTNRQTGRHVEVDDAAVTAMNGKPYSWGIIYPTTAAERKKGIIRVGGNPLISFPGIMGF
jgi:hypothetical protein